MTNHSFECLLLQFVLYVCNHSKIKKIKKYFTEETWRLFQIAHKYVVEYYAGIRWVIIYLFDIFNLWNSAEFKYDEGPTLLLVA